MSRRAELRRAARDARRQEIVAMRVDEQFPAVPGVIPSWSGEYIDQALADAHKVLPAIDGTRVEVMSYEQAPGLSLVESAWGIEAAVHIAKRLRDAGPDALVVIAARVPHAWHRNADGAFCCEDLSCPMAVDRG